MLTEVHEAARAVNRHFRHSHHNKHNSSGSTPNENDAPQGRRRCVRRRGDGRLAPGRYHAYGGGFVQVIGGGQGARGKKSSLLVADFPVGGERGGGGINRLQQRDRSRHFRDVQKVFTGTCGVFGGEGGRLQVNRMQRREKSSYEAGGGGGGKGVGEPNNNLDKVLSHVGEVP